MPAIPFYPINRPVQSQILRIYNSFPTAPKKCIKIAQTRVRHPIRPKYRSNGKTRYKSNTGLTEHGERIRDFTIIGMPFAGSPIARKARSCARKSGRQIGARKSGGPARKSGSQPRLTYWDLPIWQYDHMSQIETEQMACQSPSQNENSDLSSNRLRRRNDCAVKSTAQSK